MMITTIPSHHAQLYASTSADSVPSKLVRDTIYLPSSVAARLLGNAVSVERPGDGRRSSEQPQSH